MATCTTCESEYSDKRAALGYATCLLCGSPPMRVLLIEVNKSNPTITLDPSGLVSDAYRRRNIGSVMKTRDYVSLGSLK